jgi:hypothetical protein
VQVQDNRPFRFLEESAGRPPSKARDRMLLAVKLLTMAVLLAVVGTMVKLAWALARAW